MERITVINSAKTFVKRVWSEEDGQTTLEYALLLLFVVMAVKSVGGTLKTRIERIMNAAFDSTQQQIDSASQ